MYIDTWQWFYSFQHQAIRENNFELLALPRIYKTAWAELDAGQYDAAIHKFKQGADLARQKQLPMWEFFFESWVCEVNVLAANYDEALKLATELVTKSTQPEYKNHPVRAVVYFSLAWVYFHIDGVGYDKEIIQALDALEHDMPLDEETHHRSIFLRAEIAFEKEHYDLAKQYNDQYMTLIEDNYFRQSSGYGMQRMLAYQMGDLATALWASERREATSRDIKLLNNAVNSVLWQGVICQYLGDADRAKSKIMQGMREYDARDLSKKRGYYHILALYHTAIGDYDTALAYHTDELAVAEKSGSISNEFHAQLDRCYVLNRMGCITSEDIQALDAIAQKSKRPQALAHYVQQIKAGQNTRHAWQNSTIA